MMKIISEDEAGKNALRGDMLMVGVYGGNIDITVVVERKNVAEVINDFTSHFPHRDPVDMAEKALRAATLVVDELPPHAQAKLIGPALVLASSTPDGIDGAMGIEVTVREKDFLVEIFDLDNWKISETVH